METGSCLCFEDNPDRFIAIFCFEDNTSKSIANFVLKTDRPTDQPTDKPELKNVVFIFIHGLLASQLFSSVSISIKSGIL